MNYADLSDIPDIIDNRSSESLVKMSSAQRWKIKTERRRLKAKVLASELPIILEKALKDFDDERIKSLLFLCKNVHNNRIKFSKIYQFRLWKTLRENAGDRKQYIAKDISILHTDTFKYLIEPIKNSNTFDEIFFRSFFQNYAGKVYFRSEHFYKFGNISTNTQ